MYSMGPDPLDERLVQDVNESTDLGGRAAPGTTRPREPCGGCWLGMPPATYIMSACVFVAGAACAANQASDGRVAVAEVLCASLASFMLVLWRPKAPQTWEGKAVPGPGRMVPFAGNTLELYLRYDTILDYVEDQCLAFGWGKTWGFTTLRLGAFAGGCCFLASPATVQHVLKDNFSNYEKGDRWRTVLGDFLGNGIFSADGAKWEHQRRVAVSMFSKQLLQEGMAVALQVPPLPGLRSLILGKLLTREPRCRRRRTLWRGWIGTLLAGSRWTWRLATSPSRWTRSARLRSAPTATIRSKRSTASHRLLTPRNASATSASPGRGVTVSPDSGPHQLDEFK